MGVLRHIPLRLRMAALRAVREVFPLPYPRNADGHVRIHLGCGAVDSPGFINVDGRWAPHVHHVTDVSKLGVFPDGFAHMVYACHVLEHVSYRETGTVLSEWRRVLAPGGLLRLSVPDLDRVLEIYRAGGGRVEHVLPMLMGGQGYAADTHRALFTRGHLEGLLADAGFVDIRPWQPETADWHDFSDWADRRIEFGFGSFPVSLNLDATRPSEGEGSREGRGGVIARR